MTIATRPTWRKLRKLLAAVTDGITPERAAALANLPADSVQQPRLANAIFRAQAVHQRNSLAIIEAAARDSIKYEYQWSPVAQADAAAMSLVASADGRAPVRTRAMPQRGDWKAVAWKLERLYASEYGQQQPQQVASAVVDVLQALAALRDKPAALAVHKPLAIAASKQEHAREDRGTS